MKINHIKINNILWHWQCEKYISSYWIFIVLNGVVLSFSFPIDFICISIYEIEKVFSVFVKRSLINENKSELVKKFTLYAQKSYSVGVFLYITCIILVMLFFFNLLGK